MPTVRAPRILREGSVHSTNFSRVPRLSVDCVLLINPLAISLCNTAAQAGKAKGKGNRFFTDRISAYKRNEYRLIATKKNRIGYFD